MDYKISCASQYGMCELYEDKIVFKSDEDVSEAFFSMEFSFCDWEEDCFIMMPACAYNGNRFKKVIRKYPPIYTRDEAGADAEPLITDIPALNPDGSGEIQVTSGDMSVPCVGIYNRGENKGFFLFTAQEVKGKNLGFNVKKGKIIISYPANRTDIYRFCKPHDTSGDEGIKAKKGEEISSPYQIYTFDCISIAEFYSRFFELRKSLMKNERAEFLYTKKLWDIMEKHFNEENYSGEYYAEITKKWQCGWTGGGMSTVPLLKYGNDVSRKRSIQTLDYMTSHQAKSGFYYALIENGKICDDAFGTPGMENLHMVRKSGDGLYFLFKNFAVTEPKKEWIESAKKCADAFCTLFEKYDDFGQFVNVETGEMMVGRTFAGAIVVGALLGAWEFFGDERYLEIAKKALLKYQCDFNRCGYTNGGPGEILGAPDSESAFGLLESCMVMYEATNEKQYLDFAETVAQYCSSWVVTYSYKFPEGTEFNRLGINTVGSIFANLQNKHSSPGVCTMSGNSLLKLYRYTQNEKYLELIKDIAYFIPQCVSTDERPIYSWDDTPVKLKEGYICERVNMSDWERKRAVGGVFNCSCWCETSLILSFAELMTEKEMLPEE